MKIKNLFDALYTLCERYLSLFATVMTVLSAAISTKSGKRGLRLRIHKTR